MKFFKILISSFFAIMLPAYSVNLNWQNLDGTLTNVDGTSPLFGVSLLDSFGGANTSDAYFIQLILGNPVDIDLTSPTGVGTGNTVLDFAYIGQGIIGEGLGSGRIDITNDYILSENNQIFVRIWNGPSPDFSLGLAPLPINGGGATHFGDSDIYIVSGAPIQTFAIGPTSTVQIIPEPGTIVLMLVAGAGVLLTARRRRS
jgi:hypothetical protein